MEFANFEWILIRVQELPPLFVLRSIQPVILHLCRSVGSVCLLRQTRICWSRRHATHWNVIYCSGIIKSAKRRLQR